MVYIILRSGGIFFFFLSIQLRKSFWLLDKRGRGEKFDDIVSVFLPRVDRVVATNLSFLARFISNFSYDFKHSLFEIIWGRSIYGINESLNFVY